MSRCVKSIIDKRIDQSLRQGKYKIRHRQTNIIDIVDVDAVSFKSSAFLADDAFLTDDALLADDAFLTDDAFLADDVFIENQLSSLSSSVSSTSVSDFIFVTESFLISIVYI